MPAPSVRFTLVRIAAVAALSLTGVSATAQRHSGFTSPPTAPPSFHEGHMATAPASLAPVSSGMGAIEFYPVNYGVAAPQSLTRQLTAEDDRTRRSALAAIGAPAQYLSKDQSAPTVHSLQLELLPLGTTNELDALLTVELDHHLVTAILEPTNGEWHRLATVIFPTAFADPSSTPATFLHSQRSLIDLTKYRVIFHARENQPNGDFQENEAHVRILNGHAIVTVSFVSDARQCETGILGHKGHTTCEITHRWLQPDKTSTSTQRRFLLATATGHVTPHESESLIGRSHVFELSRMRDFTCQPFAFVEAHQRYEPTGPNGPCVNPPAPPPQHP